MLDRTQPTSYGCTDTIACNWDSEANQDDGTCLYPEEMYLDCSGNCINDADQDGECDEIDFDDGLEIDMKETPTLELLKMIDVFGRVQKEHNQGKLLFYLYKNGEVKKIVKPESYKLAVSTFIKRVVSEFDKNKNIIETTLS